MKIIKTNYENISWEDIKWMKKLNLGCGFDYREGYINCDMFKEVNPDIVLNLEAKLPFEDNSIEEVLANHILEHITFFIPLMHELHRILKVGGIIKIRTPFYSTWGQFNDPTHVRFFTPFTFNYFKENIYSHEVNCNKNMFKVNKVRIHFGIGQSKIMNCFIDPILNLSHRIYCRFFAWIFPAAEIEYELEKEE